MQFDMLYTNLRAHLLSYAVQKDGGLSENESKRISERKGISADCLEISKEGNRQYMSARRNGAIDQIEIYDIEEMGKEAWEAVTGIKILNYLESSNIAGTEASVFQRYQSKQYKVFQQFLEDNNAYGDMMPEAKEAYETMLVEITKAMDEYGAGGYKGISKKSMLLAQNMIAQLEYFNTNYVPEYLQDEFQKLIEECDYFNQNSREKMFAERMPCDIVLEGLGDGLVNKEKSVVIKNYLDYHKQEKEELSIAFSALRGKSELSDINAVLQSIEKWYYRNAPGMETKNIFLSIKASWKKLLF